MTSGASRWLALGAAALTLVLGGGPAWAQAAAASVAPPADGERRFYGYAYDLKTDRYLYTEVHRQTVAGGRWVGGTIEYFAADGRRIGGKTLDFSDDPFIPTYRFEMPGLDYVEAITDSRGPITMRRQKGDRVATEQLPKREPMCADSGFHSLLVDRFGALMAGQTVAFRMAVAGSLDAFKFKVRRIDDTRFEGRSAVRFRVDLDSLLGLLVDPLVLTYDPQTRRLLEYRGLSNVLDPSSGDAYVVRIAYYAETPPEVATLPSLNPDLSCERAQSSVC